MATAAPLPACPSPRCAKLLNTIHLSLLYGGSAGITQGQKNTDETSVPLRAQKLGGREFGKVTQLKNTRVDCCALLYDGSQNSAPMAPGTRGG